MISGTKTEILKALNKATRKQTVLGGSIELNRKILEHKKTGELILNHKKGKDSLYQRDSGLNQVLCKIAKNAGVTLTINLRDIQGSKEEKAKILSRIRQNLMLIKKYKNKLRIIGKNKHEAQSILLVLGLPTQMIKQATA